MSPDLCSNFRSARATSALRHLGATVSFGLGVVVFLPLRGRLAVKRNKSCFVLPGEPDLRKRLGSDWSQWRDDQLLEDNMDKVVAWPAVWAPNIMVYCLKCSPATRIRVRTVDSFVVCGRPRCFVRRF
jgi:hypothetical protein